MKYSYMATTQNLRNICTNI